MCPPWRSPAFPTTNWATPKDIVARLHHELVKAIRLPDIQERLRQSGSDPVGNTAQEFGAFIRSEHEKWAGVIRQAGIQAE